MPMKHIRAALISLPLLAACGVTVLADNNETPVSSTGSTTAAASAASLTGRVLTPSGAPIANASVLVQSLDKPAPAVPELAVTTGADGRYSWPLPAGRWEVTVFTLDGAQATKNVATPKSGRAVLDFTLAP